MTSLVSVSAAEASGLQAADDSGDAAAVAGSSSATMGVAALAVWVVIVTVALGVLALVVYRKLKRSDSGSSTDTHSVSSGSRASSDLTDFGDSVMTGAPAAASSPAAAGVNNDAFTIDAIPDVHQSSPAASTSADTPVSVRL